MARTTINLDDPVLADLKRLQRKEGKPLGELASELLASAIAERKHATVPPLRLQWTSRPMGARVDLDDKEALFAALDEHARKPRRRS
ncbi:MAG TPA: antitoxin [Thermoanaerobaculia bacterium]